MTLPPPRPSDSRRPKPAAPATLTRFPVTRTGSWTRPWENQHDVEAVAAALAPPPPARPQVAVVVDPDDAGKVARATAALACRRSGRIVVHTTPGLQPTPWRLGIEVLCALGKHWDRFAQRCDVPFSLLCTVWLRAEQVRDLVVLRAHHLTGKALAWLLELPAREQLRLWLCAPGPLPNLNTTLGAAVLRLTPDQFLQALPPHAPDCRCDDLNRPASAPGPSTAPPRLTPIASRLLRRLCDPQAAALGAAALLLGRPHPAALAAARLHVTRDTGFVTIPDGCAFPIPEHARGLLRGWRRRELLPRRWARDVAETFLVLQLEEASRHVGLSLLDRAYPMLPPTAWHQRCDPGAELLAWHTRSVHLRTRPTPPLELPPPDDWSGFLAAAGPWP